MMKPKGIRAWEWLLIVVSVLAAIVYLLKFMPAVVGP